MLGTRLMNDRFRAEADLQGRAETTMNPQPWFRCYARNYQLRNYGDSAFNSITFITVTVHLIRCTLSSIECTVTVI